MGTCTRSAIVDLAMGGGGDLGMIDPPEDYIFDSITRDSGRSRRQVPPFDDNDSLSHLLDIFPSCCNLQRSITNTAQVPRE